MRGGGGIFFRLGNVRASMAFRVSTANVSRRPNAPARPPDIERLHFAPARASAQLGEGGEALRHYRDTHSALPLPSVVSQASFVSSSHAMQFRATSSDIPCPRHQPPIAVQSRGSFRNARRGADAACQCLLLPTGGVRSSGVTPTPPLRPEHRKHQRTCQPPSHLSE
jgi:hypothetical protein